MSIDPICGLLHRTPLGWMAAAMRNGRLLATALPVSRAEQAVANLGIATEFTLPHPLLLELERDLQAYFAGESISFRRYRVDLSEVPPFLRQVLLAARTIPYGQVRTYGWLAARAGRPSAARAAGQAMARNPLPLVIPCHRVIAAGGGLGGFGGGLELKRRLLMLEGVKVIVNRVELRA